MFDVYKLKNHRIESKFELDSIFLIHHGIKLDESTYNTVVSNELLVKLLNERSLFSLYDEFLDYVQKRDYDFYHVLNDIYDVGVEVNKYINNIVDIDSFLKMTPPDIVKQPTPINGHQYLVFDMCEAIVQTLIYYGFNIGGNCWDEIISRFTDEPYLKHNKRLRNYAFIDIIKHNVELLKYIRNMTYRVYETTSNAFLSDMLTDEFVSKIIYMDSFSFDITEYKNKRCLTNEVLSDICSAIKHDTGMSFKAKIIKYNVRQLE